jgi:alpha-beta hydrolase superfamily lysophospholipase
MPLPEVGRRAFAPTPEETLVMQRWPSVGPPQAVILALHGFGDAGELTYAGAAPYWASRGIAVYAPDQRGFGANPSRRRWPGAEALVEDAVAMAGTLRARHPGVPLVVVGHSMGGGVALAAAAAGMDADALVLAGPAIAGGDALNPALRASGWIAAVMLPERRWTGEGVVDIRPSDNDEALLRVSSDPRHFGDPSSRELFGLVRVMDLAAAGAPDVRLPTLTLMGARDEILEPDRVRQIHDRISGGVGFVTYPDGWHWLFRDHQAARVWTDVADFVLSGRQAPG